MTHVGRHITTQSYFFFSKQPKHNNESTITCNDVPLEREVRPPAAPGEDQYVYDLYYMNKRDVDLRLMENLLAIEAYQDEVHFDRFRNPEEQEVYDDEDDSNDESNWRNDYPDEDPKFFENQDAEYSIGQFPIRVSPEKKFLVISPTPNNIDC